MKDIEKRFMKSCQTGDRETINSILREGFAVDFDEALAEVCEAGHLDLAQLMIDCGATWLHRDLTEHAEEGMLKL